MQQWIRKAVAALVVGLGVGACGSKELVVPSTAIRPLRPSFQTAEGYVCPTSWIRTATIPGNVYPYHTVTVGRPPFQLMPFMMLVDISPTGLEKGKYAIAGGGPFVSNDNKIAVVSGNVSGWCHYLPIQSTPPGSLDNFTGALQVTDFDGEIINIPPPKPKDSECDDPLTDLVEPCDPNNPPPSGSYTGAGGTVQEMGYTPSGPSGSSWVCYVTDWYESYDGGATWNYVGTTVDSCTH